MPFTSQQINEINEDIKKKTETKTFVQGTISYDDKRVAYIYNYDDKSYIKYDDKRIFASWFSENPEKSITLNYMETETYNDLEDFIIYTIIYKLDDNNKIIKSESSKNSSGEYRYDKKTNKLTTINKEYERYLLLQKRSDNYIWSHRNDIGDTGRQDYDPKDPKEIEEYHKLRMKYTGKNYFGNNDNEIKYLRSL
jgi:hypothetical protein